MLALTSCEPCDISNEYASFKEADTEYKLFLEMESASTYSDLCQDLESYVYKNNQNEYKDKADINQVVDFLKEEVLKKGDSLDKNFYIMYKVMNRNNVIIEASYIRPKCRIGR